MLKRSDVVQIPFPFSVLHQKCRSIMLLISPDVFGDFISSTMRTSQIIEYDQ